ncbi:DMT family transporter [Pelagibius litoralis]|uniref:DMT family transporter n=1 Tax=Pelagibius litoralis TaxID=374515 RepID=A0A967KCF4_9PROT|nr:DMT family transporter [Pelagibius litoralis]NIA70844.1 DMT family transporter [Pelagibius litoralis]
MPPASPTLKAIAWMMGALLSFAFMTISVRELTGEMHAFQMLFIRSAIGVCILLPFLQRQGWGQIRVAHLGGHATRNVIHFTGQVLWISGIALLPLATVTALEFTAPLWGGALAVLFLGEKMNRGRWIAFGLGFVGVLVIIRPGFIEVSDGILIMLACAFFFGATGATTKWLTRRETALAIVFYMVAMQAVMGAVASSFVWTPPAWHQTPWLLLLAITGLSAHYCLTRALAAADATFIMPMEFLRLPLIALFAYLLYAEAFEFMTLLGAAIIFSGNFVSIRHETRSVVR